VAANHLQTLRSMKKHSHSRAVNITCKLLVIITVGVLIVSCRTTPPPPPLQSTDDEVIINLARLNGLMGVRAQSYRYELQPDEVLLITWRAQKNGVDLRDDTATHKVTFEHYQKYDQNYPAFDQLKGKRFVDIEILEPGHSWNPESWKVSLKFAGYHRFFHYFDERASSMTRLSENHSIERGLANVLLNLRYENKKKDVWTLKIEAQIKTKDTSRSEREK
jgi:hypothetical protein